MPYRAKAGSWQPARLRWVDHAAIMVALIFIAFIHGFDYLTGDDNWGAKDFMIAVAPEWVWGGVGFLAGAMILSFGVTTKRHLFVYIGHGWLWAAYGLNALALVLATGPPAAPFILGVGVVFFAMMVYLIHTLTAKGKRWLSFAALLMTVAVGGTAMAFGNPFDGIRGAGAVGMVSVLHFIHMIRTGGRPLRPEQAKPAEHVLDGDAG